MKYDALMGIKRSMQDDLYLLPSESRVRNVRFLGPDPTILSTSYAAKKSEDVNVAVSMTIISCMALSAFIATTLYQRRDKGFRFSRKGNVMREDEHTVLKGSLVQNAHVEFPGVLREWDPHDESDNSVPLHIHHASKSKRRVTFAERNEERIFHDHDAFRININDTEEMKKVEVDDEYEHIMNIQSCFDLLDLSESYRLHVT